MFKKIIQKIVGDPGKKLIKSLKPTVDKIASLEATYQPLSTDELKGQTAILKQRLSEGETLDDILADAFALVREASRRATGLRHYDVQLMGGLLLHQGQVVEMRTGEGKTLVATLPLYLNSLTGRGVHLVTINDYLARRDGGWMGKIFHLLGLTVGCLGPLQFSALYDPEYVNPGAELEDERLVHWRPCERQEAYLADITYGISSEFGFDYLRDNMVLAPERLVQRELHFAVIDEVDNILIDEARTPLIISGPAAQSGKEYVRFADYVRRLKPNTADEDDPPNGHFNIDEKSRTISLTELGIAEIERRVPEVDVEAGDSLYDPRFFHLTYYLDNALRAEYLFRRDHEYVVQDDQVMIVDDFTGRLMPGRRYSDGLHEAIEAKEGVQVKRETVTVGTITLQNYFRLYEKLGGMTGTAVTDAEEFGKIYELAVTPLPTNVQYIVDTGTMGLKEHKHKNENADEIFYTRPDSPDTPLFYKRTDFPDQVYRTPDSKDQAIIAEIKRVHASGRPILVGTTSVEHSELIHRLLKKENIEHNVLNAKLHQSEALTVAQAGRKGAVTISTNMAGRGTDILLGGNPEGLAAEALEKEMFDRLQLTHLAHQLLTEGPEAARQAAGRHPKLSPDLVDSLLAVQTEYNNALPEIEKLQVVGFVAQKLQKQYALDYNDVLKIIRLVQSKRLDEARQVLKALDGDPALVEESGRDIQRYASYQTIHNDPRQAAQFLAELAFDLNYKGRAALIRTVLAGNKEEAHKLTRTIPGLPPTLIERIEKIKQQAERERGEIWQSGGLHVVGSERHEARRIDNQLRGRAARQGDPGSSRFFLSLDDDLMRRFGGERLKRFMTSNVLPDDVPLEMRLLDQIIANAQERIEGYNFDLRKNVVEYDDVMNKQRQAIYGERRKILSGNSVDLDERINIAFETALAELVHNYLNDYLSYVQKEVDRAIADFSTDATDTINLKGVINRLRGLMPGLNQSREELAGLPARKLSERLMRVARQNKESGQNLYQLLQAMNRFLPLLPPVPNVAGRLATMRSGHLQARENIRRDFIERIKTLFDTFLTDHLDPDTLQTILDEATTKINQAFLQFNVESQSVQTLQGQQIRFKSSVDEALRSLLLSSLAKMNSEQLLEALQGHIGDQQEVWRTRLGQEEFENYQRVLLLSAIDREWRDYLTAMDDLRREIGLEAVGQRDPKVEYKRRSYQMFADMRANIDRDVVDRFFRELTTHQEFVRQQEIALSQQVQMAQAGYQKVQREKGKGVEVRRDLPKVGRNDSCPCGSGKKYKNCHMRHDLRASNGQAKAPAGTESVKPRR